MDEFATHKKTVIYQPFNCRDCGTRVLWAVSKKTGKTYLAQPTTWRSDCHTSQNGRTNERTFYPFHDCTPDPEYQKRVAEAREKAESKRLEAIEEGFIVKGQKVRVFKGRKYPIGTIGEVFWIAPMADAYDVVKAGVETETGEKIWINVANLEAVKS